MKNRRLTRNSILKSASKSQKQTIRRAKRNKNPLRIGKDDQGNTLFDRGKKGQTERVQFAEAKVYYEQSLKMGLRSDRNEGYNLDARSFDFSNRKQVKDFLHYNNATAQHQRLMDRANSFRQSFRTRSEELGISKKVMQHFDERFSQLGNAELLQTLNKNMDNNNITFDETFGSDQPFTEDQQMKQLINMYRVLGIGDEVQYISFDDINSGYVDNRNFTHFDFDQAQRKENRRSLGRI